MITIKPHIIKIMENETRTELPNEACGLLVGTANGDDVIIEKLLITQNVAITPHMGFEIDPKAHMQLEKLLRDKPQDIVGVYHSHPTSDISLSNWDIEQADRLGWAWIIGALDRDNNFIYAAYIHKSEGGQKFIEEEIALEGDSD
jgi:proteasome lid subunit RPN8/RPN11